MSISLRIALVLTPAIICGTGMVSSAQKVLLPVQAESSVARKIGQTGSVSENLSYQSASVRKRRSNHVLLSSVVPDAMDMRYFEPPLEGIEPVGPDPLLNDLVLRNSPSIEKKLVFEGMRFADANGSTPPDPNGDVSDNYFVQAINRTMLQVFDKEGTALTEPFSTSSIWSQVQESPGIDPIIEFDELANRWILMEYVLEQDKILLAISDNEDPLGDWVAYVIFTAGWPDYIKLGVWGDTYIITVNEDGFSGELVTYMLNRQDILQGKDEVRLQRIAVPGLVLDDVIASTPVGNTGERMPAAGTSPMFVHLQDDGWGQSSRDLVELYEVELDWDNSANTQLLRTSIETSPFNTSFCAGPRRCISQFVSPADPGDPPDLIDGVPFIIMNKVSYRNFGQHSSIVLNFTVDASGNRDAGIRWMELRKSANTGWSLYQEGTVGSLDGIQRFMGAIAIDALGNVGLGYSVSSKGMYPSLRFTGRLSTDRPGIMTIEEYQFATGVAASRSARYGDYASMSVDANNEFWFSGEYIRESGFWGTVNAAFLLGRPEVDLGPFAVLAPEDATDLSNETLVVSVRNFGKEPLSSFTIGYQFAEGSEIRENVNISPLPTDSLYIHEFSVPIQFTGPGSYEVRVFTELLGDENDVNNELLTTIRSLTSHDAAIDELVLPGINLCDTFTTIEYRLINAGQEVLTSASVQYSLDDVAIDDLDWTGYLRPGESELIRFTFSGITEGERKFGVSVSAPNGFPDENPANDIATTNATVVVTGANLVILELRTDLYPEETSWELRDSAGEVLYSDDFLDGVLATYRYEWCLDRNACYEFVLFDSFGDGIEAEGVAGDFTIRDENGVILAALSDPGFGSQYVAEFCADATCTFDVRARVAAETAPDQNDGIIQLTVVNGTGPFEFSLDDGRNFQFLPIFRNLSPGEYRIVSRDANGCVALTYAVIPSCSIQVSFDVTDASSSGAADGAIRVTDDLPFMSGEYSLDGITYQESPFFENLPPGDYFVWVRDSLGCEVTEGTFVGTTTSIEYIQGGHIIRVFPNPSKGRFSFEVSGPVPAFLRYDIVDVNGKLVHSGEAAAYGNTVRGNFALFDVHAGMYFLRFRHEALDRLVRVVKAD